MVLEPESLATNLSRWVILLCVSLLASACGDEPVEKTASCQCPEVETAPAAARYQAPDMVYTRSAPQPVTPSNQMYMMQPQTIPAEPVWDARQQTYTAPQNTAFQNQPYQQQYQQPYQQHRAASPWAMQEQSAAVQQFQDVQRPWGQQTAPAQGNQTRAWGDTSRQQPNQYQWGVPAGGGYYGWGSDPYGATQGAGYPGYAR
jgi:hypothetical protein